jgi:hypothetical protein
MTLNTYPPSTPASDGVSPYRAGANASPRALKTHRRPLSR